MCETCNGTARVPCPTCGGEGAVLVRYSGFAFADPCPDCNGKGWHRCPDCRCDCGDNWTDGRDHRDCWRIP